MGNEEHAPLDLAARNGLGDIVQQSDQPEPPVPPLAHPGADLTLRKLPLHAADGLEDVLEGIEVVEGTLPLTPGEPELRHLAEQCSCVERGRERLMDRHVYEPYSSGLNAVAVAPPFYGWCWDCSGP